MTTTKLQTNLTRRYAFALSLIAVLSTGAFAALYSALQDSNHTAFIVNISGKQRMLSQHIALDVHRVYKTAFNKDSLANNSSKQLLLKNTQEMLKANQALSSGNLRNEQHVEISTDIYEMYFGEKDISSRVKNYTINAVRILDASNLQQAKKIVDLIDTQSESLLMDLNAVVKQYEIEGDQNLLNIQIMEIVIWITTIFILLLEVIFIFQPMIQHILHLAEAEERSIENLQNQVNIRTLSLQQANQKLETLASHDPLTGLKNRLNFEQDLEYIVEQHVKNHCPYAILMFDIDFFKQVNDAHGHDVGDLVIVDTANLLKQSIRQEDKVYRIGGEEFIIVLNRVTHKAATGKAEDIRQSVEDHIFHADGVTLKKTISGGLYHSSVRESESLKEILKLVDDALYSSKQNGRNQISHVVSALDLETPKRV